MRVKKGIVGMCMALALATMATVPAFAAESTPATSETAVVSSTVDGEKVARGVLSGYNQTSVSGNREGSFMVNVSGSGSPFAGCTLKTSGFSSNAEIKIRVMCGEDEKIGWKTFGSDTEFKNIAMWFVEPGGYKVEYKVENNAATGTIQCWIY